VPTNLVEGLSRRGPRELRHFLDIALGSLAEVSYLLQLARDLGYLSPEDYGQTDAVRRRTGFLLWRLYESVSASIT
jgi:four helix bundle protein